MIVQILIDQLASKNYVTGLKGRYLAKVCSFDYRDSAGGGQHFVLRLRSNTFNTESGTYGPNALLFSNQPDHGRVFDAPKFIIEAYGSVDLALDMVAGTGIGTLSFAILTLDVEPIQE